MHDSRWVTVEIKDDDELLSQVQEKLWPYGLTVEELIVQFLDFCANPATQDQAVALLTAWRAEQAALEEGGCAEN